MPNYPGSLDDDVSLFLAVNNARTRLTSTIDTGELTIPVVTTSGFPNQGFLTILTNPDDITEAEAIRYEGLTETTFSGVQRGAGGTFPFVHAVGNFVDLTVMAEHHNELKDAVIALENVAGVSGSHNFVPKDEFGNATVSGTLTVTEDGDANICGPAVFKDDVLFTADITVSGIATFGIPPSSTLEEPQYVSNEIPGTLGNSTSFSNVLQTSALETGDKYLVLYRGNIGWDPSTTNTGAIDIRSRHAGQTIGFATSNESVKVGHTIGADLAGFQVITGNGSDNFRLEARNAQAGSDHVPQYGSLGILTIPLDGWGLVEGTDYWYINGDQTGDTVTSTTFTTTQTLNLTVPDAGEYIVFCTAEVNPGIEGRVRFQMDGSSIFTNSEIGSGNLRAPMGGITLRTLTGGAHTLTMQHACNNAFGSTSTSYQESLFVMRVASFDQVKGIRSTADTVTNSATFTELTDFTQTFTPNQEEQILVLGTAGFFTPNDTQGAGYKIANITDAVDYSVDSGMEIHNETSLGNDVLYRPTIMFGLTEPVTTAKEFQLQHRNPQAGGAITTTDGALVLWGLSLFTGVTDTQITTIDGNTITTHEVIADVLTTTDFNAENVTVTGVLDVTQGVTYLGQTYAASISTTGNIISSGTLSVVGDTDLCADVDIKGDLTVSGTVKVGQATPIAAFSTPIFASNDVEQSTTSTSLVDTGCETAPLANGVEYLVIYTANTGNSSVGSNTAIRMDVGGTKTGSHDGPKSNLGSAAAAHYNDSFINGIVKVTGNGTDTVKFRYVVSASTGYVGAQSILALPLDSLTEGTDYYYAETANNDTFVVTNAPISDPPATSLLASTFTSMAAGDYIFMWSSEQRASNFTSRAWVANFQVDGNTIGASRYGRHNANSTNDIYNFAASHVVNIPTGGNINVEILVGGQVTNESDFRRGRIFAVKTSVFNQVISTTDSTGFTTASTSYQDFVGLNTTITPSGPNTPTVILSSATTYTKLSTASALHAIRNETDGIDYRIDSGERNTSIGGDGTPAPDLSSIFMVHFEERSASTEYRHQLRTPSAGDVTVGRNDDDTGGELSEMIVWEFTPVAPFIPITQTCIDDDQIQTGELIADTITARQNLTVSGLAPHVGDPLSLQNLIVEELACLTDVDIKGDLTVSGTAKFGQDDTPAAANGDIIFASQDTEQTTTSTAFVDANCETAPLLNGVEYLIIYNGNTGIDSETVSSEMQVLFGATRIGRAGFAKSALGTFGDAHYNAGYCHGIYRTTGDGSSTVKFEHRVVSGSNNAFAGAMSVTCIPLDSYTQNTDYFWVETSNSDTPVVSNAPIQDPPNTALLTNTFTSMDAGEWLFMWSAGSNVSAGTTRGSLLRFQVAGTTIGTSRYSHQGRSAGSLTWNSHAAANLVNVAGGNTAVDILVSSTGFALSDFYRGRIFAIKTSLFTQVLSNVDTTGAATSSSSFVDFTPLNTTIVPTQPNSPIVVLTTAPSYTQENSSGFTSAIRNETAGVDYRVDSGGREAEQGGIGDPDVNLANSFMTHFEERTASTEYRYQYRTVGVGPVAVGRNDDDTGGEHSEMIVWEFLNSGAPFVPITQTCIDDDQIQTGTVIADTGTFNTGLTVSGQPVSTGTGGGGAVGDFVARSGDSMTGDLDMAGNIVRHAGTVIMQDDVPVITTSGLLWFDTDATGHGSSGSANLPGGFSGALLTSTSGTDIPDDGGFHHVAWDTTEYDNGNWVDPAFDKRLVVPSGVTRVQITAGVRFDPNAVGDRRIAIARNTAVGLPSDNQLATNIDDASTTGGTPYVQTVSTPVLTVSGGDFFSLTLRQTSGGTLAIDSVASVHDTFFSIAAVDTRGIPGVNSVNLLQGDVNVTPGSGIAVNANSQTGEIEISLAQETRDLAIWSPDAPPASGTSFDSEWGRDGAGLTGWTEWDVAGALTASTLPRAGVLRLKHTATIAATSGLIKTAPTNNFTIFTRINVMENRSRDFKEFGIVLSDDLLGNPSTANFAVVTLPFHEDGSDADAYYFGFGTQHFTDYNSFDRNLSLSAVHFPAADPVYLKVHVDVTTRVISTSASKDGLIWHQEITSDFSGDLTNITEMGYWISNNNASSPLIVTSDFFRVVENIDHSRPLHGDFLTVSGVPQAIVVATGTQTGGGGSGDGNITDINAQEGPSVTVTGVGPIQVITEANVLTITGTDTQGITGINSQLGPEITITGTAGIGVVTVGNVITIDGTEVQGSGGEGSGITISGCYTHYQTSASATWNIAHNLASMPVNYIVLDNANTEVIPNTFTVDDSNSVTITFVAPQAGRADIFPCVSGTPGIGITEGTATVSGCYSHVQTVSTGTWTVNHNLGTDMVNYVVLDNAGSQVQPDDFTVIDDNQITLDFVSDRTGIANVFACVDGDVTFNGGIFANLVAVTGTFLNGITVGTGTTYITSSGIDTPELKINGQAPSFGGAVEFISSTVSDGSFIPVELPAGYRRFELHIVNMRNASGGTANMTIRQKTVATPSFFTSTDTEGIHHGIRSNDSTGVSISAADITDRSFHETASVIDLIPTPDTSWRSGFGADDKVNGILNVVQVGDVSTYPQVTWDVTYVAEDGRQTQVVGAAKRVEKSRITGLQFQINTNGTFEGTVYLYGYPE